MSGRRRSSIAAFVACASVAGCFEPCPTDDCTDVLHVTLAHASKAFAVEQPHLNACVGGLCTRFELEQAPGGAITCTAADGTPFPGLVGDCSVDAEDVMRFTAVGKDEDTYNVLVEIHGLHGGEAFREVQEDVESVATCGDECRRAEVSFTIP